MSVIIIYGSQVIKDTVDSIYYLSNLLLPRIVVCIMISTGDDDYFWKREKMIMQFGNWPFYLPIAFFVPPTQMILHVQFNLLYQFWIHTELVKDIGPLEYILNSAKHHRVHHGNSTVI